MDREESAYHELCAYTLAHGDPRFIHQHVVDAFGVQHATLQTKPIGIAFGLVGLYLKIEKAYTGRQVQQAHMALARTKREWPAFQLPDQRGSITVADVLAVAPGLLRDKAIDDWCASVWAACHACRPRVQVLLNSGS